MAVPEGRSSHADATPNLGGAGLFIAFSLCLAIFGVLFGFENIELKHLLIVLTAVTILFFLGIKDDLIGISPLKKLLGQTIVAILIIALIDVRIHNLGGIFNIIELPYLLSVIVTIFGVLFFVNAFNLIDGVDGLAGSIAIIASASFGFFFFMNQDFFMALISFILIGSLSAFLIFNFSKDNKLFMGDSGSLFIGFLLIFQAMYFLGSGYEFPPQDIIPNSAVLIFAILSYPIIDTTRVFIVRIANGKSPFTADRNHLHHRLLNLGLSHKKVTLVICTINVIAIASTFILGSFKVATEFQLVSIIVVSTVMCLSPLLFTLKSGQVKFTLPKLT